MSAPAPEVSQETQPSSLWGKIKSYLTKTDGQFNTQSPFTVTPAQPVKIEPYKAPDFTMKASDIDNGVKNGTIQPISSIHGDGYKDELGNIYDKTGKQIYKTPMSKTLGDVGRNIGAFAGLTSNAILTDAVKGAIDIVNMGVSGSFTPNEKNPDGILSKASKGIEDFRNKLAEDTKTNIMTGKDTTKQGIVDTSNLIGGIFSFAIPDAIFGKVGEVAGGVNKLSKTYDALIAAKDFQKATEVANQIQKTTSIVSKAKGATMAVYGGLLSGYNDAQSVYNDTLNNIKEWRGGNITEQDKQVALQKANEAGTKSTLLNTLVFGLTHSLTEKASNGIMNKLNIPQSSFADTIKSGFSGANTFALQTMVGNYVNNRPIFENVADQATMGGIISGLLSAVAGGSVYRKSNEVKQDQKAQIQRQNDLNTLGVNENSTPNEIRSAYINLAKTNHPDTGGNAETMAKINDAYSRLHPSIKDINTLTDEMNSMAGNNQAAKDIIKQESQKAKDFIVAKEHIKNQLEKDPSSSQSIYADLVKSGIPEVNSQAIIDNAKNEIISELSVKKEENRVKNNDSIKNTPENDKLLQEAKNYNTPEEFIKSNGEPLYHGTVNQNINELKAGNKGGDFGNAVYITKDINTAKTFTDFTYSNPNYESIGNGKFQDINTGKIIEGKKPNILNVYLDKNTKLANITEAEYSKMIEQYREKNGVLDIDKAHKNVNSFYEEMGYDGLNVKATKEYNEPQIVIFEGHENKIKTESQLKSIWNQAHSEKNAIIDNYGKDITSKDSKSSSNSSKSKIRFEENITDKDKVEIEHDLSTLDEDIGDLYADIKYSVSDHIETEQNYNKLAEVAQIYNRIEKINQDTFGIKSVTEYADSITDGNGKLLLKYKFYAARHGEGSFSAALSKAQHRYDKYGIKKPLPAILKNYDTTELASYLENTAYKDMNVEDAIDELIDKVSSKNEFIKSANTELKRLNKRAKELSKELKINQDAIWDYVDYDYNIGKKIETKTPQEAPSKIETATEDPEIKKSRAFQRLKHKIDAEYQNINEPTYQVKHRDEEIAKAIELYKQNPKYAERVALGLEKAPEDISETMISRVVEDMAAEKGDSQLQADTLSLRSLKQTIRGQELAMEGTTEENSAEYFIKRVLQKRRELAQKGYNPEAKKGESIEKQINKKKSKMGDSFRESVKIKAKYLDDFLDEITCPY